MEENRKKQISKQIGNRIYNLRKEHNLSREKFAEMCNLSSQYVYYMEKGDFLPGCITLIDICNNFEIAPSQLLIDSLNINPNVFCEAIFEDFNKLSSKDKKFLQEMIKNTIHLLLEENDTNN